MKICVLGNGMLADDFKRLNFIVLEDDIYDFDTDKLRGYDTIINIHEYGNKVGETDIGRLVRQNVQFSSFISNFCKVHKKHYVYLSTGDLYHGGTAQADEKLKTSADNGYEASKLLSELNCDKKDIIIRTKNVFNDQPVMDNALYRAVRSSKPTMNVESYTWTVDLIRSIVVLLKKKKHGVFNVTSDGSISQSRICNVLDVDNVAPHEDKDIEKYHILDCSALHRMFTPMGLLYNLKKCYSIFESELEVDEDE